MIGNLENFFNVSEARKSPRKKNWYEDFSGSLVVKHPPANIGDMGLIPMAREDSTFLSNEAHAPELLKRMHPRARAHKRSPHNEEPKHGH